MTDIFFSEVQNDIVLRNGDLVFTGDFGELETIRQAIRAVLLTFLGEWFLDNKQAPSVGVPYFQSLLIDKIPPISLADAVFRDAIFKVPGVQDVLDLRFAFNRTTRIMDVSFKALTTAGDVIDTLSIEVI